MFKPFSLLIKPASADCNLRCEYCFYLDKCELYPERKVHRMSLAVLERMIASYMKTSQPCYAFGWQGGEPTLMGIDFFRKVTEVQRKYGQRGVTVANGLQTNGTMISDEMARHFAEYKFLLGVSLDGPADIHDFYRKTNAGSGSHELVMQGIKRLEKYEVEFNILVLVNAANVKRARELYHYYLEHGFHFLQFIPCVEFDENDQPYSYAISGEEWGDFLCEIYDLWYQHDTRKVSIRLFDSMLNLMVDNIRNICLFGRNCCQYFVVENSGDIYPCDFFVTPELKLGNIMEDEWEDLQQSRVYLDFGRQKPFWNRQCDTCKYLHFCSGDCLKNRIYGSGSDPRRLSWLCSGWQQFYEHALPGLRKLAEKIRIERAQAEVRQRRSTLPGPPVSVGRNDPCPCGSGKKYKKCCLKK